MPIKSINRKIIAYLKKHNLVGKFAKQKFLFEQSPLHPSLQTEKLEPKSVELYSFRVDKKYRAIFRIRNSQAEIVIVTKHYE